jgi:carbamoyltransferase
MKILGIAAYYHDSSACLIIDGEIVSAVQEERYTRVKHDSSFPVNAITFCLEESKLKALDLDYVVFYDKPFLKFERILETYLAFAPKGFKNFSSSLPAWIKDKLFQKEIIIKTLKENFGSEINWGDKLLFSEHHLSHASSAFFPSPFQDAAVLTMDGVGEWATTSLALGSGNDLSMIKEINFPHSLGLLYSAFTYYAGFKVNSGEYKLMGLAPYGEPKYTDLIKKHLINIKEDGSFHLDINYFQYCTDLKMTNEKFNNLFGGQERKAEGVITQKEMDIAASIQVITEEVIIKLARGIKNITGAKNLCLAGGVALNCVANGRLLRENIFENIWIQPASGDAGGAIGAALSVYYLALNNIRKIITVLYYYISVLRCCNL